MQPQNQTCRNTLASAGKSERGRGRVRGRVQPHSITRSPQPSFASGMMLQTEVPLAQQKLCPSHIAEHFLSHLSENIKEQPRNSPCFHQCHHTESAPQGNHRPVTTCGPYSLGFLHEKTEATLQVAHFQLEFSYFLIRFFKTQIHVYV